MFLVLLQPGGFSFDFAALSDYFVFLNFFFFSPPCRAWYVQAALSNNPFWGSPRWTGEAPVAQISDQAFGQASDHACQCFPTTPLTTVI